jgi:hypothetical protein
MTYRDIPGTIYEFESKLNQTILYVLVHGTFWPYRLILGIFYTSTIVNEYI